jgi:hypothetical protein
VAFAAIYQRLSASWLRYFELAADSADGAFFNFAMSWNRGDLAVYEVLPNRVATTVASKKASMPAKMALQIDTFQEAANWSSSRTTPGAAFFRASSRWYSMTCVSASSKFALASSRVSPSEKTSGNSSK